MQARVTSGVAWLAAVLLSSTFDTTANLFCPAEEE